MGNRRLVVAAIAILTVLAAVASLSQRSPSYEATAHLLVTPLPQDDRVFLGIDLLRDSGDPTRTVQTAATIVESPETAKRTAQVVGSGLAGAAVEGQVTVEPLGESNVVAITATAGSAALAAALANTYARQALELRGDEIGAQIDLAIAALDRPGLTADERARLLELRAVADRGDPTLRISQRAEEAGGPTGPPAHYLLTLALIAGLVLGAITAVLMERFDRRVRELPELLELWPLPILARVPPLRRGDAWNPATLDVPRSLREAFATLQIQLDQGTGAGPTVLMVTSASRGDGKTTCALNLAFALVGAGRRVILMDFDLRKPDLERQLGVQSSRGLMTLLSTPAHLGDLLSPTPLAPLRVISAASNPSEAGLLQALARRMDEILREAGELADHIVIDTAPLGEVGDALAIAGFADEVLLVGRPGNSDRAGVELTRDLLIRAGVQPRGWIVVGVEDGRGSYPYYADDDGGGPGGRARSVIG